MNITQRIRKNKKAYVTVIKHCISYKDIEDFLIDISLKRGLNFLPFKNYNHVKSFFDSCLTKESMSAWDLEIQFNKWKTVNNLKATGILQSNYYILRGYTKQESDFIIKEHQTTRSNTNKLQRVKKSVKTKQDNNLYTAKQQARGRNFYLNKGFSYSEVDAIINKRNNQWQTSMQLAIECDPSINPRKGRNRHQLIEQYGYTKACDIIASRLNASISKPEKNIRNLLSDNWQSQWYINTGNKFFIYDFINHAAKIILEFNGDIWHANPELYSENWINPKTKKTAKEIWKHDKEKKIIAELLGYKVVTFWEKNYNELRYNELRYNNKAIQNKLYEIINGNI